MLVIVIDRHFLGDGRIKRHLDYISKTYTAIRLNFAPDNKGVGACLLPNNILCYCQPVSSSKETGPHTFMQYLIFAGYFPNGIKSFLLSHLTLVHDVVIHIHDPSMLTISLRRKKWLSRKGI